MLTRNSWLPSIALCLGVFGCASGEDDFGDGFEPATERASFDFEKGKLTPDEVAQTVALLGLDSDHLCGDEMIWLKAGKEAPKVPVFKGPGKDAPWHKWRKCLETLRGVIEPGADPLVYDIVYNQVLYVLSHERVRFYSVGSDGRKKLASVLDKHGELQADAFERFVETNDHGLAYSAMGQVDLGITLLRLHKVMLEADLAGDPRAQALLDLGLAAMDVLVDEVKDDGLRSKKTCELDEKLVCSWFHGVTGTSREKTKMGGTLNKHLYAARDLYQSGGVLRKIDEMTPSQQVVDRADKYQKVALQGMNQMVYSASANKDGDLPTLMDYIPRHQGEPVKNSWLYYGRNIVDGDPYFLDNGAKNCTYHLLVIKLLERNLAYMQTEGADISGFTKHRSDLGGSVLEFVLATYDEKIDDNSLFKDSPSKGPGTFKGCRKGLTEPVEPEVIAALEALHD